MMAGQTDFLKTVPDPFLILNMRAGYLRHSGDGVHGGADIMAHTGKKVRFCSIGTSGRFQRFVQHIRALFQLALKLPQFRDIRDINKHG